LELSLEWKGKGVDEKGIISKIDFEKAKALIEYQFINQKMYKFDFSDES
jgi:hypothetical protein